MKDRPVNCQLGCRIWYDQIYLKSEIQFTVLFGISYLLYWILDLAPLERKAKNQACGLREKLMLLQVAATLPWWENRYFQAPRQSLAFSSFFNFGRCSICFIKHKRKFKYSRLSKDQADLNDLKANLRSFLTTQPKTKNRWTEYITSQ